MSFAFNFTKQHLSEILKKNKEIDAWHEAMSEVLPKFDINTPLRVAGFLAQCAHESLDFTVLQENLNYSADGLRKIFPRYFTNKNPDDYARQPQKIASLVYGGRMGNGPEASAEGWKYRGRGPIQLTGKDNYTACSKDVFNDLRLVEDPDQVSADKRMALTTACWFWKRNNLNALADAGDIVAMTRRINGGTIGLDDRKKHYSHALSVLGGSAPATPTVSTPATEITETVRRGSRGATVAAVQRALSIAADGDFGPGTEAALKKWQAERGLVADGIAGPRTLKALLG
jgi:putative chitinase